MVTTRGAGDGRLCHAGYGHHLLSQRQTGCYAVILPGPDLGSPIVSPVVGSVLPAGQAAAQGGTIPWPRPPAARRGRGQGAGWRGGRGGQTPGMPRGGRARVMSRDGGLGFLAGLPRDAAPGRAGAPSQLPSGQPGAITLRDRHGMCGRSPQHPR
jgi:hypothetical protein